MGEKSAAVRLCPDCGGMRVARWGHAANGVGRLRCGDCGRSFTCRHGTASAGLHDEAAFDRVLADMASDARSSCRALAARLGLDKSTVWRWRQRINEALSRDDRARVAAILDGEATRLRESRKASREWVNHERDPERFPAPDRPRWVDVDRGRMPPPTPIERFLVTVQLGHDTAGDGIARVLGTVLDRAPRAPRAESDHHAPHRASQAPKVLSVQPPEAERPPGRSHASSSSRTSLRAPFKTFLAPFRGPATRYLDGYAAWFTISLDPSIASRLTRARRLVRTVAPTIFADMRDSCQDGVGVGIGWGRGRRHPCPRATAGRLPRCCNPVSSGAPRVA